MLRKALKPLNTLRKSLKGDFKNSIPVFPEVKRDTWCPMPWLGMGVRSVGDLRYCCHAQSSPEQGLLRDESGKCLNLKDNALAAGKNAPLLKQVRLAMLNGERPSGCDRCYREEDAGIQSRRQSEKLSWAEHNIDLFRRHTEEDGTVQEQLFPLRYLDLRFGNKCNLKCRMCGPTESDKWYELTPKVWDGTTTFKDGQRKLKIVQNEKGQYGLEVNPYQWYASEKFWLELEKYLPRLQRIYLAGGEPLLIDAQFDFLEQCIKLGYAKNITLEYNSNITALTPKILRIWSQFRKVEIGMSIDGIGPINDYIRSGSQWAKIEHNLRVLDGAEGYFKLWWACTVQIYNFLHLPETMHWIIKNDFERINQSNLGREIFTPHPLTHPTFLAITTFPEASKHKIKEIFADQKQKIAAEIEKMERVGSGSSDETDRLVLRFQNVLDNYVNIMFSKDTSDQKSKFWDYTEKLDAIHGVSLKSVSPRTYELMK